MNQAEVGYVCGKGRGHFSLAGMNDHGACGSHMVGKIYVSIESGYYDETIDADKIAQDMEDWIARASAALEREMWNETGTTKER